MDGPYYVLGALVGGLLAWATCSSKRAATPPLVADAAPLMTMAPLHAPVATTTATFPRGLPPPIAAALLKATPKRVKEPTSDTVARDLGHEVADRLARRALDALNCAGGKDVTLHFIAVDGALLLASGLTRVAFTAYDVTSNTTIKFIAFFDDDGVLRSIRLHSALPDHGTETTPFERAYAPYKPFGSQIFVNAR
jgi:hypothetical protein